MMMETVLPPVSLAGVMSTFGALAAINLLKKKEREECSRAQSVELATKVHLEAPILSRVASSEVEGG